MRTVFIRAPYFIELGNGVEVLARFEGKPVAVGRYLATAFYPELTDDARIRRMFADMAEQTKSTLNQ